MPNGIFVNISIFFFLLGLCVKNDKVEKKEKKKAEGRLIVNTKRERKRRTDDGSCSTFTTKLDGVLRPLQHRRELGSVCASVLWGFLGHG